MIVQTVYDMKISDHTKIITMNYFSGQNMYRVSIPKNVEEIQDHALRGCKSLREMVSETGSALRRLENYAFDDCENLRNI